MAEVLLLAIPLLRGLDDHLDPEGTLRALLKKVANGGPCPSGLLANTTGALHAFSKSMKATTRVASGSSTGKAKRVSFENEGSYKVPLYEAFVPEGVPLSSKVPPGLLLTPSESEEEISDT